MNMRLTKRFAANLFIFGWTVGAYSLSSGEVCKSAGACQEPRSLSLTNHDAPCSYIFTHGWPLYIFLFRLSTPDVSNIATWWWRAVVFIFICDRPCPHPHTHTHTPPPFRHTHTHTVYMKDKYIHVLLYLQNKKPLTPPKSSELTVKFWFSRAGRSSHPSSLLTSVTNEKQDKRDFPFGNGLEGSSSIPDAVWKPQAHQGTWAKQTYTHIWHT